MQPHDHAQPGAEHLAADFAAGAAELSLGPTARGGMVGFGLLGVVGIAAGLGLGWLHGDGLKYFWHAYLVNYCFVLSLTLGGLFFVLVQHATRAGWSVTCRRLAEIMAANMPLLGLLFLPLLIPVVQQQGALYPWAGGSAASDAALAHKAEWFSPTFFTARAVIYLAVWLLLGRFYLVRSLEQDAAGGVGPTLAMERLSPVGLLLYAGTLTFASFDWLMSLTPHWSSTIYGVYFFSGCVVGGLAVLILAACGLQSLGRLRREITVEHYHDLGKLLFAFVVFWGYIAFSQYLLIWYTNIPEETTWYQPRHHGPWGAVSLALLFGHLLIPMLGLLSRHAKRWRPALAFWAVWLLIIHWVDLDWLVMPALSPERPTLLPIDVCLLIGMGGLWLAGVCRIAGSRPLLPLADPRLHESLTFENAY